MILDFNKDLSSLKLYANWNELASVMWQDKDEKWKRIYEHPISKKEYIATFDNPVLVTDFYKISKLDPVIRDTVFMLFSQPIKITEYNWVSLEFEQKKYPGVWGPSIDTLLFCRWLDEIDLSWVKKALEVWIWSGFISKYLLEKNSNIEQMTLIDLNKFALDCASFNIKDTRAKFFIWDAIDFIEGKKYDLIVCNPPYISRPKSIDDNPYEWLQLLSYLILNAKNLLNKNGKLIVNISSLWEKIINKVIEEAWINVNKVDFMEVPLKVFNVLNNKEWMEYLKNEKWLIENEHDWYKYWHIISIMECTI